MVTVTVDVKSIPHSVMDAHCYTLLNIISEFYDDPKNQAAYETWHLNKYGCMPEEIRTV
jgi:hypothetical protein